MRRGRGEVEAHVRVWSSGSSLAAKMELHLEKSKVKVVTALPHFLPHFRLSRL